MQLLVDIAEASIQHLGGNAGQLYDSGALIL